MTNNTTPEIGALREMSGIPLIRADRDFCEFHYPAWLKVALSQRRPLHICDSCLEKLEQEVNGNR